METKIVVKDKDTVPSITMPMKGKISGTGERERERESGLAKCLKQQVNNYFNCYFSKCFSCQSCAVMGEPRG